MSGDDAEELARFGQTTIAEGSKSFALASLFFGADLQTDVQLLYAWCRHCDDVVDGQNLGGDAPSAAMSEADRAAALEALRTNTARVMRGDAVGELAFDGFARVVARTKMPAVYPQDHLDGFAYDVAPKPFDSLDDVLAYCYGVAGVVGVMMAIVMGVDPEDGDTLDRACDLGLAFQLTNICRDVVDDAAGGRVYLPADGLARHGVAATPAAVADPAARAAVWRAALEVLDVADLYYASATKGVRQLPIRAAAAVAAARNVYREIGARVRDGGPEAWDQRVVVSSRRKTALAAMGALTGGAASMFLQREAAPRSAILWTRPHR